ncbi:hypothetical protein [Pseudomonas botevensis]|uniref:hypothetical protein n=1 Tax=Pseudomonas botevensis TaxID=2842352 RepID=UPI001C3C20CD|nr:hypothetical protein [Pseudomonas botevensis]MBV4473320.1 hypothetical protein [Pseudomonas botevensis]
METFIGVCAGVIGIVLGVIGVVASLHPPKTRSAKMAVVALFVVLSALAVATTVVDRQRAERDALAINRDLSLLKDSSSALTKKNDQLLQDNLALEAKIAEMAQAPLRLALEQTLKRDIKQHLERVDGFLSSENDEFNRDSGQESNEEHAQRYSIFRRQLASDYVSKYFSETRALLLRAANLKLIPMQSFEIDGRFIEAGMIPYVDELQKLSTRMAD